MNISTMLFFAALIIACSSSLYSDDLDSRIKISINEDDINMDAVAYVMNVYNPKKTYNFEDDVQRDLGLAYKVGMLKSKVCNKIIHDLELKGISNARKYLIHDASKKNILELHFVVVRSKAYDSLVITYYFDKDNVLIDLQISYGMDLRSPSDDELPYNIVITRNDLILK